MGAGHQEQGVRAAVGAVAAAAVLVSLAACGGGNPPVPTAAGCFNSQLFTPGTKYTLIYQLSGGAIGGSQTRQFTVDASPGTGANDVIVSMYQTNQYDPPVPSGTLPLGVRDLLVVDGTDIVTKTEFISPLGAPFTNEFAEDFQPPLRDIRYSLSPGQSFAMTTTYQVFNQSITTTTTVTYVGAESITVPAGVFDTCRFQEQSDRTGDKTVWIIKGKGIAARTVTAARTEELYPGSQLNGQRL